MLQEKDAHEIDTDDGEDNDGLPGVCVINDCLMLDPLSVSRKKPVFKDKSWN